MMGNCLAGVGQRNAGDLFSLVCVELFRAHDEIKQDADQWCNKQDERPQHFCLNVGTFSDPDEQPADHCGKNNSPNQHPQQETKVGK